MMSQLNVLPLEAIHSNELFLHLSDPALYRFIPGEPPVDAGTLRREFSRLIAGSPGGRDTWLNWVVFDGERAVGTLQATIDEHHRATIAYVVFVAFWRRGYATRAAHWLLEELFLRREVLSARAYVDARNTASLTVARSIGMNVTGDEGGDRVLEITSTAWQRRNDAVLPNTSVAQRPGG